VSDLQKAYASLRFIFVKFDAIHMIIFNITQELDYKLFIEVPDLRENHFKEIF